MKHLWYTSFALGFAALILGAVGSGRGIAGNDEIEAEARRGLAVAPIHLDLRGKDRSLVGLGSYIVNVQADCNGCHSRSEYLPDGDPFQGLPKRVDTGAYLRGGRAFGPFVSRNLRPEFGSGHPAGLTFSRFVSVMRHGTDFDQAHPQASPPLQVMPWPAFQDMTNRDLLAIYEYLRALPPVPPGG